jgi:hypothetical protein
MLAEPQHWHSQVIADVTLLFPGVSGDRMAAGFSRPAASRPEIAADHIYGHHARSIVSLSGSPQARVRRSAAAAVPGVTNSPNSRGPADAR